MSKYSQSHLNRKAFTAFLDLWANAAAAAAAAYVLFGPHTQISVVADLPGVGENLQDHIMVPGCFKSDKIPADWVSGNELKLGKVCLRLLNRHAVTKITLFYYGSSS